MSEKRVKTLNLDCYDTIGNSAGCAKGLSHSLKRFFGEDEIKYTIYCTMTDSGGGGTGHLLYQELEFLEITVPDRIFWLHFVLCIVFNLRFPMQSKQELVRDVKIKIISTKTCNAAHPWYLQSTK